MGMLSAKKFIRNDYAAFVSLCLVILTLAALVMINGFGIVVTKRGIVRMGEGDALPYDVVFGTMLAIALLCLICRFLRARALCVYGVEVSGTIVAVRFYRDRGRVSFEYRFGGTTYRRSAAVSANKLTQGFAEGSPVTLLVDERRPRRALIKSLYAADGA